MNVPNPTASEPLKAGLRHVTILFSDLVGFSDWTRKLGDLEASRNINEILRLQETIITRDGLGQVLQFGGDSVLAVFDNPSAALNCALEIQRALDAKGATDARPTVRIGLHMGEVLVREGERLEIISRHVNRAHRVMEVAAPGQILASEVVVEAARDFIDIPMEFLAIEYFGEYYLKGVGATGLCEVADLRSRKPQAPQLARANRFESALLGRLELAGYRPAGRLGEGAHGVVYKAHNANGQTVAIKVLSPTLCEEAATRQRFVQEAARMRQLQLPGLARLFDERLDHRIPFIVMELIEGQPADSALAGAAPARVAKVFREICRVLDRAHGAGLIHRDLKPANILVKADDSPVLLDFGISVLQTAKEPSHLSSTTVLGTPAYLSPEVITRGESCVGTDIYSLGVLLFKVLTGREPFEGESVHQILQAHLHEDPPLPAVFRPQVPDGLQRICLKSLEKKPADRYHNAQEMAQDLERFIRGEMVRTRPSFYDNLLYHRAQKHANEIRQWAARGLLNEEEMHGLLSSYEGLQRRGIPAVMEGRFYRLWQTIVYVGGWAVVNGALLWLVQHWDNLSRGQKLTLGSVPALTAFALSLAMWKLERFRLTFVALVVGILAVPVFVGVWLHEFNVGATVPEVRLRYEVFHREVDSAGLTNQQLWIISAAFCGVAAVVMFFTRTTTHSAQAVSAAFCLYSTSLLWGFDVLPVVENEWWATLALKYLPLLLLTCGVVRWLLNAPGRSYQAPPWLYFSALLLMAIFGAVSLRGLHDWSENMDSTIRDATSFLFLSIAGGLQTVVGLLARSYLGHRCRLATLMLIVTGLVGLLAGLGLSGSKSHWPTHWWMPVLFNTPVPLTHLLIPVVSLIITLLACRFQMFAFLLVGLTGFAGSIHLLGYLYFETSAAWPKLMMGVGAAAFFTALYLELRRTRSHSVDDLVSQSRL